MKHPLEQKIQGVRRRVRRQMLLYGLAWTVATVIMSVVLVSLCDFLFRFEDPGIRFMATGAVAGLLAWSLYRCLFVPLARRMGDVQIAQRIERRFPGLNDRLASTVQFLREAEEDPQAGSATLRRAVISQTTAEVEELDLRDVVQTRPARRMALAALIVCLVTAGLVWLAPEHAKIALTRLANPVGDAAWPKLNHLAFREAVHRVALGQPLELAVVDARGARLPAEVRLRMRFVGAAGQTTEETVPLSFADGAFVYRQDSVTRPFEYKAEGGDDTSMPWTPLTVVEPPSVESLSVTLHPPAYTGWPSEKADKHFRAIKGTRVELHGTSTKPLSAAALKLEDDREIPARLHEDGYGFSVPADGGEEFLVEQSGSYSFSLTDREGFQGGSQVRYEIRAVADLPPTVSIQEPSSSIFVTAEAAVPLEVAAKDDLAIRDLSLVYLRSDQSEKGETTIALYQGPEHVAAQSTSRQNNDRDSGEIRAVEHHWELAPLGLKPGSQITFHAAASDYQPQAGQSQPLRLTIITPQELNDRIAERQTFILGELARVLKMQQESRSQVSSLEIQLRDVGRLGKQDIDHLQGAELTQRQVERSLSDPGEGVKSHIEGLLNDLKNNKVDSPDVERRMQQLLGEIDRIRQDHLPVIEQQMQSAIKGAQSELPKSDAQDPSEPPAKQPMDPAISEALTTAGQEQDQVIASLEQMLGELSQWDNYRRFHREIGQLKTEQEEIAEETSELGRETLTKDVKDLSPQQQADLKKLGQRQQEASRRFDKLQQQMEQMGQELEDTDPLAAGVIDDALHQARQQGISGQMREAGQNIEQNQVGQAAQRQDQVTENLQELLDTLANRSEHELGRLVKKLREAEEELTELRRQQQGLRKKMAEAAKNPNEDERRRELERLSREQKKLQEEAERFARKLQRLQAEQASRSAAKASGKMAQAGEQGEQGDADAAQGAAEAAEKDLDEAQQALAERRKQAEMDLAMEQLAKIEDALKSMRDRQQEVVLETERLESVRSQNGNWTRGQALSVRDLARQQAALEDETESLADKLSAAEVFSLALKGAGREMTKASELLAERDTGQRTQNAEQNALRRFEQLLKSLEPDKPDGKNEQGDAGGGDQGGQQQPPTDGIPSLAQLKLLKLMQEELNGRTKSLEDTFAEKNSLTDDEQREYVELSEEQSQLADMVLNLSKPAEQPVEGDPEALPDLKLDDGPPKKLEDPLLELDDLEIKP